METSAALKTLQEIGVANVEIFFNTYREMEQDYITALKRQLDAYGTHVKAFHPFTSGMETFFFASMYQGRMEDGILQYRRYFEVCRQLSIPRVVFHGDYVQTPYPFAKHCENYLRLRTIAREYGVEFCQENVVRCKCGTPHYLEKMRELTRDDVSFVLDVKQMRRAGVSTEEMLDAMAGKISHVHLSDETELCDCAVPGTGYFDFKYLFEQLHKMNFAGDMVVELYRGDFKNSTQLLEAVQYLDQIYAAV
ncbi:MAG: sugar phosphate isomerase/epimerase [Ruthenibacterium sp.]